MSATYFRTLDLPVVAGRGFNNRDTRDSVPVCIVNEAFVRGHAQGRSPIGLRVAIRPTAFAQAPSVVREIVGVARQVKGRPDETEDLVQIYRARPYRRSVDCRSRLACGPYRSCSCVANRLIH